MLILTNSGSRNSNANTAAALISTNNIYYYACLYCFHYISQKNKDIQRFKAAPADAFAYFG